MNDAENEADADEEKTTHKLTSVRIL